MKRAAGLLIVALLAVAVFSLTAARADLRCFAWGGGMITPLPGSEDVYEKYVETAPPEVQTLLAPVITRCTNDYGDVGFGICVPPDPSAPCTDPT